MKKSNKIMALVLAGAMAASMTACGSKAEETTAAPETEAAAETTEAAETEKAADASGKTYKIGVIQLVQHVALDKTNEGFVQALEDAGYERLPALLTNVFNLAHNRISVGCQSYFLVK